MNLWRFSYNSILPYLKKTPLHPIRNEKELPLSVLLMIRENKKTVYSHPMSEHVPDISRIEDIDEIKKYLEMK
jgi:hypothetical protein